MRAMSVGWLLPKRRQWVALAVFLAMLLLGLYLVTLNSEDYVTAERFVAQNPRVAATIGDPQQVGFKFWAGFDSVGGNGGQANYTFSAMTDKGEFVVEVRLRNVAGAWRVETADVRGRDGTQTRIAME